MPTSMQLHLRSKQLSSRFIMVGSLPNASPVTFVVVEIPLLHYGFVRTSPDVAYCGNEVRVAAVSSHVAGWL